MPGLSQQFWRAAVVRAAVELAEIRDHPVDECHRLLALCRWLSSKQQAIVSTRTRLYYRRPGLLGQRVTSRLLHDANDVAEESRFRNDAIANTVKFRVTQKRHFPRSGNPQPVVIEQSHHVAHAGDPDGCALIGVVAAGHEDVFAALQ